MLRERELGHWEMQLGLGRVQTNFGAKPILLKTVKERKGHLNQLIAKPPAKQRNNNKNSVRNSQETVFVHNKAEQLRN
jgi:hypothetical protein